jgi:hypothetical protein
MAPPNYKLLRLLIFIPTSTVFMTVLLVYFDIVHHIVGLFLHILSTLFLWVASLLASFHSQLNLEEIISSEYKHTIEHLERVWEIWPSLIKRYPRVLLILFFWLVLVSWSFIIEVKRIGYIAVFRTLLRDQLYILEFLYIGFSYILEKFFGRFVRKALLILSNEKVYEAIKESVRNSDEHD